jgi:hypothetical protein
MLIVASFGLVAFAALFRAYDSSLGLVSLTTSAARKSLVTELGFWSVILLVACVASWLRVAFRSWKSRTMQKGSASEKT